MSDSTTTAKADTADDAEQTAAQVHDAAATKDAGESAKPQTAVNGASDTEQTGEAKPDSATKQDAADEVKSEKADAAQAEVTTQAASAESLPVEVSPAKTSSVKTPSAKKTTDATLDTSAEVDGLVAKESESDAATVSAGTSTATSAATATLLTDAAESDGQAIASAEWRVITETVPGASHLRHGIPNQDSVLHVRQSSVGLPIIAAVADGHGSDKCFRSDRGSRYAVRTGAELLDEVVNSERGKLNAKELEEELRERLPAEFVRRWRADVEADLKREPLTEEEFTRLVEKDGARARQLVEANTYLAYGTTTLHVLLTDTLALYLQLGDGEIITVSKTGEVALPLPGDARLLANETTSLCLPHAAEDFRFVVKAHEGHAPAIILLTTDGYYNSFSTTEGFLQVGSDLLQMLGEEDGFGTVNRAVKGWLEEATQAGSGDDCSLAIVVNMDALRKASAQTERKGDN